MAFAAMLPGIFVQVPSGLASQGSLINGLITANQFVANVTGNTTISASTSSLNSTSGSIWNVGLGMIQVAIGVTVGVFTAVLLVYGFGKHQKRSLFSF